MFDFFKRKAKASPADAGGFDPQNELERMLVAAATDPTRRSAFEQRLVREDLFAATPAPPEREAGWRTAQEGETLSLLNVTAPDGSQVAALFTSEARVGQAFGPGAGYVRIAGAALLEMVAEQGAYLNPGLSYGVHWGPGELFALLGKPRPRTIQQDTEIMLGSPAQPPVELIAALRERLGDDPGVGAAWLALALWPATQERTWYLDVRTGLSPEDVHARLGDLFARADFDGLPLDMIINPPGAADGIGIQVAPSHVA